MCKDVITTTTPAKKKTVATIASLELIYFLHIAQYIYKHTYRCMFICYKYDAGLLNEKKSILKYINCLWKCHFFKIGNTISKPESEEAIVVELELRMAHRRTKSIYNFLKLK